jgi:probable F420-dependent oxidoreductase
MIPVGAVYPQIECGGDPGAVRAFGDAVDALGFDHVVAYDHVLAAEHADRTPALLGPYTEADPFHDPFVLFAYLAGRHPRLAFASGVLILPQRQTALVARQAADLALLTGDRFRLGVGVGWNHVEYTALGQAFGTRGARADEQIELLRRYWTEPLVSFEGRFDRVERAGVLPRPASPVPVWIGGFSPAAFTRAARLGDGFFFGGPLEVAVVQWDAVRGELVAAGRAADPFGAEWLLRTGKGPDEAAAKIGQWEAHGGTHASVVTMGLGFRTMDDHVAYLAGVAGALGLTPPR